MSSLVINVISFHYGVCNLIKRGAMIFFCQEMDDCPFVCLIKLMPYQFSMILIYNLYEAIFFSCGPFHLLGAVELGSAGVSISIFNIISKLFNIPLLSVATSFVAEDLSKSASKDFASGEVKF